MSISQFVCVSAFTVLTVICAQLQFAVIIMLYARAQSFAHCASILLHQAHQFYTKAVDKKCFLRFQVQGFPE